MFQLTNKLAISNLIKNRKLYYPFALATILAVMISYLFYSLTFNPHIGNLRMGATIQGTLSFGLVIVTIAASIIILYANSFVMKNRSKELGTYGMLGLEKRHLIQMTFKELLVFGLLTITSGIAIGAVFDKLIYAILFKLMKMKAELVSTFQWPVVLVTFLVFGLVFLGIALLNAIRIGRMNALQLSKEKNRGEKQGRFLGLQTIVGLISLGAGYFLALSVESSVSAIGIFFIAVLLVILATYLLFNAGITVFLKLLKKNKRYYYQTNNFISVSNLIFRMKKNAVGLATIAILSTMVLVTMSASTNIFKASETIRTVLHPHDFSITGRNVEKEDLDKLLTQYASEKGLTIKRKELFEYAGFAVKSQAGNKLQLFGKENDSSMAQTVFLVFDQKDYETMTGEQLNLSANQVGLYANNKELKGQDEIVLNDQAYQVQKQIGKDFIVGHVANQAKLMTSDFNYLVVPNLHTFLEEHPNAAISNEMNGGMDVTASEEEQVKLAEDYENYLNVESRHLGNEESFAYGSSQAGNSEEINAVFGGFFFIGIFLSIIFMVGAVLVIYYKQISEGYEDRERFVILQKVGLDDKQIKQTINKQVLTVFFLPLFFAFLHLAFAYHMLSLILKVIGVVDAGMMLTVTLSICGIFVLVYIAIFMVTSRSYRKIVQM